MRTRIALIACICCLSACSPPPEEADYDRRDASPGGSGKVFLGREIATPRTDEDERSWFDRPTRETEELSNRLLEALQLRAADHVADIGSGTGFYTIRLARRVSSGRVMAVDVDEGTLATVASRAEQEGLSNIFPVHGTITDPRLDESSIDLALIVVSYHEFSHPREMLQGVFKALKPGGRLAIVEYRGEDDTLPIPNLHRMSEQQIRREAESIGFEWRSTRRELPQQHLVLFARPI